MSSAHLFDGDRVKLADRRDDDAKADAQTVQLEGRVSVTLVC